MNTTTVTPVSSTQQKEAKAIATPKPLTIQPFPKPPVIQRVETPEKKYQRELQRQSMATQRETLRRLLMRRIEKAQEAGNNELLNLLLTEYQQL